MPALSLVEQARRINRTWKVRGGLGQDTENYLDRLARERPEILAEVCERAVTAAQLASREKRDPKPDFYASIFSRATEDECEIYLKDHLWTCELSAKLQKENAVTAPPVSPQ